MSPDVNSSFNETRPSISWDGTELYFWTNRDGTMDVFEATRSKLNTPR
jgi:Tol biopolymer transport system component